MLLQLIKASDRSKLEHAVLTLSSANAMAPEFEALGIPVTDLQAVGLGGLTAFFRARKLIKAFGPNVLMTWLHHSDLFGVMLRVAMPSLPLVWNIRCSKLSFAELPWRNLFIVRLLAWLSWAPTVIVTNSVAGKREHIAVGYRTGGWRVLPNGFDTKRFTLNRDAGFRIRMASGIPMDGFVVGLVGRYHPMKGFDLFTRVAGRLAKTSRAVHFVLVGADVDAANVELRDLIAAAELEGRITLLGQRTDIADVMNAFDVIACTSTSEGFSNVIGEAMSCGVPCVATDVGDNATLVGPGGSIVPAGDADALLAALIRMVETPPELFQELKIRARAHILKNFAIEDISHRYEELFDEFPIRAK
jgi:glycosyltransferase involved in cell wall biosynthesis